MPETQEDARCQVRLPVGLGRDNFVHQGKKSIGVILDFNVDVELGMSVFRLCNESTYIQ